MSWKHLDNEILEYPSLAMPCDGMHVRHVQGWKTTDSNLEQAEVHFGAGLKAHWSMVKCVLEQVEMNFGAGLSVFIQAI